LAISETSGSAKLPSGIRVLIVEDETLVAMLLEDMIIDLGGKVVASASRLSSALQLIADPAGAFDLAILDVNLSGEDAFPAAVALAERNVPFAFSTGYGKAGLPAAWRSRPTLQKPFTRAQVASVLGQALAAADRAQGAARSTAVTPSMTN
jgi:CheY-like chemotaxis protein